MEIKRLKQALLWVRCAMLIVAMALAVAGCGSKAGNSGGTAPTAIASETASETEEAATAEATPVTVLGEGKRQFNFGVADKDGKETWFEIHTDEETVGAALQKLDLIAGEEGQFGLYVKTVNGITADYDKDKVYWAFYVNGEYGTSGVDTTEIREGDIYSFRIAK